MDLPLLRVVIREKLADVRLSSAPVPRVWTRPGHGETCDGCGEGVTTAQTMMENRDTAGGGVRLHVACFHVWDGECQMPASQQRLPARSAFRTVGARPMRPWTPSPPFARPATP